LSYLLTDFGHDLALIISVSRWLAGSLLVIADVARLALAYAGPISPYLRTVKTTSGAAAVQIVYSLRGSRDVEFFGSVHDEVELEAAEGARHVPAAICRKIRECGHRRPGGC
jgi:hypothetical protein